MEVDTVDKTQEDSDEHRWVDRIIPALKPPGKVGYEMANSPPPITVKTIKVQVMMLAKVKPAGPAIDKAIPVPTKSPVPNPLPKAMNLEATVEIFLLFGLPDSGSIASSGSPSTMIFRRYECIVFPQYVTKKLGLTTLSSCPLLTESLSAGALTWVATTLVE
ncbi:hypothetical protein WICPIJ_008038 [Wickerhamomyces pijperi]|uniref:Uncharacterized protein n=1 Tax=Wickerhamomyces pijperi TaxID=599730 RepID=A0A9P8TIN7_WICPI|nr:hypothetical protein WICPIJ_008038 [Wickerhamomyces pijperi]